MRCILHTDTQIHRNVDTPADLGLHLIDAEIACIAPKNGKLSSNGVESGMLTSLMQ